MVPHRGLLILLPGAAKLELENWKSENKQAFVQSGQRGGEHHQLLPASAGLTVPECPFLSFSRICGRAHNAALSGAGLWSLPHASPGAQWPAEGEAVWPLLATVMLAKAQLSQEEV